MGTRSYLLVLMAAFAATACAKHNNLSVQMTHLCNPPDASTCKFPAGQCETTMMGNPGVDVAINGSLWTSIETHNYMRNSDDIPEGANNAYVDEVEVSYDAPGFGVRSMTRTLQQMVPANGSTVLGLELLDENSASDLATGVGTNQMDVVFNVTLKGHLGDQATQFETAAMPITVSVCNGCMGDGLPACEAGKVVEKMCPDILGQTPVTWTCK